MTERDRLGTAAPLLLILLALALHLTALRGWWLTDDPQVLVQAIRESPSAVLFQPHAYRYLSSSSFTPLVTISFDFDHSLFGVDPRFYYAHQLGSAIAAALLLFFLLRRFSGSAPALLGAAALLASPSLTVAVRSLMLRHYVEGLALAIGALLVWTHPRRSAAMAAGASALYLLAMLAKEFYAPLPLLMIAADRARGERWQTTVRHLLLPFVAAVVYVFWRWSMLGGGGGYGGAGLAGAVSLPQKIGHALATTGNALTGTAGAAAAAAAVGGGLLVIVAALRSPRAAGWLIFCGALFLAIPLLFVGSEFDPRYAFPSAAVVAGGVALAAGAAERRHAPTVLLGLFCGASLVLGLQQRRSFERGTLQMTGEGQYVWGKPATAPALLAWSPGWYLDGLRTVRRMELGTDSPRFILSTMPIALGEIRPADVWTSHPDTRAITPIGEDLLHQIESERSQYAPDEHLFLRFRRDGSDLAWSVGPEPGHFTFVTLPGYDDFPMPEAGDRRLPEAAQQEQFRIRRDTPDGRWTLSPPLPLPLSGSEVRWERTSSLPRARSSAP